MAAGFPQQMPQQRQQPQPTLCVCDLPEGEKISEAHLFRHFNDRKLHPVASVRVCRHNFSDDHKGHGFVSFHTQEAANIVFSYKNYTEIEGKPCRLIWKHDQQLLKEDSGKLWVGNLALDCSDKDLDALFQTALLQEGRVISCKVASTGEGEHTLRHGLVQFATKNAATLARWILDGKDGQDFPMEDAKLNELLHKVVRSGMKLQVAPLRKRQSAEATAGRKLFVTNFGDTVSKDELQAIFENFACGGITSVSVTQNRSGKAVGYVVFQEREQALSAIAEMNGKGHQMALNQSGFFVAMHQSAEERAALAEQRQQGQDWPGDDQSRRKGRGKGKAKGNGKGGKNGGKAGTPSPGGRSVATWSLPPPTPMTAPGWGIPPTPVMAPGTPLVRFPISPYQAGAQPAASPLAGVNPWLVELARQSGHYSPDDVKVGMLNRITENRTLRERVPDVKMRMSIAQNLWIECASRVDLERLLLEGHEEELLEEVSRLGYEV